MADSLNHEEALVKAFIPAHRQERFLEIIAKPKKRAKLLTELSHFKALNPKFMIAIPSNQQNPFDLVKLLRAKGAGTKCYVMSENRDLDGHEVDLETAPSGLAWRCFLFPLIEPDRRSYRIQLSEKTHDVPCDAACNF